MRRSKEEKQPAQRLAMSTEEAAEALGISRAEIYRMLQRRQLAGIKLGRRRLVPMRELERLISEHLADTVLDGGGGHAA
jgi:excisionase family DNA binding protein